MGADIKSEERPIPESLRYLFDIFMKLKFSEIPKDGGVVLVARDVLDCHQIDHYSHCTGLNFDWWEAQAILQLDTVFERAST